MKILDEDSYYTLAESDRDSDKQARVCIECISNRDGYCLNFKRNCTICSTVCSIVANNKVKYNSIIEL